MGWVRGGKKYKESGVICNVVMPRLALRTVSGAMLILSMASYDDIALHRHPPTIPLMRDDVVRSIMRWMLLGHSKARYFFLTQIPTNDQVSERKIRMGTQTNPEVYRFNYSSYNN